MNFFLNLSLFQFNNQNRLIKCHDEAFPPLKKKTELFKGSTFGISALRLIINQPFSVSLTDYWLFRVFITQTIAVNDKNVSVQIISEVILLPLGDLYHGTS
jgi:hypothetical protein